MDYARRRRGRVRDQEVRIAVADEQRGLEEEDGDGPHRGRAAEHRQHHLGEHRLHGEQQQRREERRRRVGPEHEPRMRQYCKARPPAHNGRRAPTGRGPRPALHRRVHVGHPARTPHATGARCERGCRALTHTVSVWPTFGTTTLWSFISATNLSASGSSMPGKGAVVAGQDHLEVEELLAGEGGRPGAHGEAVADRHDADVGLVELGDQRHAAEHVGVAHVIERLALLGADDDAVGIAEVDVLRGGVQRIDERQLEIGGGDGAAGVHRLELLRALRFHVHGELEVGKQRVRCASCRSRLRRRRGRNARA